MKETARVSRVRAAMRAMLDSPDALHMRMADLVDELGLNPEIVLGILRQGCEPVRIVPGRQIARELGVPMSTVTRAAGRLGIGSKTGKSKLAPWMFSMSEAEQLRRAITPRGERKATAPA